MKKARPFLSAFIILIIATLGVGVWILSHRPEEPVSGGDADSKIIDTVPEDTRDAYRPEETGEWNTYHGDAALSGAVSAALPDQLVPLWRFRYAC